MKTTPAPTGADPPGVAEVGRAPDESGMVFAHIFFGFSTMAWPAGDWRPAREIITNASRVGALVPGGESMPDVNGQQGDSRSIPAADNKDGAGPSRESVQNLDAAFYHESAAFHHRRASHYMVVGPTAAADRHIWAAFGHSLNAHECTRACVSSLGERTTGIVPVEPGDSA